MKNWGFRKRKTDNLQEVIAAKEEIKTIASIKMKQKIKFWISDYEEFSRGFSYRKKETITLKWRNQKSLQRKSKDEIKGGATASSKKNKEAAEMKQ